MIKVKSTHKVRAFQSRIKRKPCNSVSWSVTGKRHKSLIVSLWQHVLSQIIDRLSGNMCCHKSLIVSLWQHVLSQIIDRLSLATCVVTNHWSSLSGNMCCHKSLIVSLWQHVLSQTLNGALSMRHNGVLLITQFVTIYASSRLMACGWPDIIVQQLFHPV